MSRVIQDWLKASLGKPATPEALRDKVMSLLVDENDPGHGASLVIVKMIQPEAWARIHASLNEPDDAG